MLKKISPYDTMEKNIKEISMITRPFQDKRLPLLGLGCMRFPLMEGGKSGDVDMAKTREMIRRAMEKGVNYFDTAWPYHEGKSESILGEILSEYPRESYFLADKFPGHQIAEDYFPEKIFEEQLKKCRVKYFDFYLLHNVFENSIHTYLDPKWGILDYFLEQKRQGRIRHLGFSTHGSVENMTQFLDACGEHMEFCQIQLNYLDWTLQNAAAKVKLLQDRNIPIWVMEPVRGGRLAKFLPEYQAQMDALSPGLSPARWAFRFLQDIPGVTMVLSGMSNGEQLEENIQTFEQEDPLTEKERKTLFAIAECMKNSVPCTSCGYCLEGCPKKIDIPFLLSIHNELQVSKAFTASMRVEFMPEDKKPGACISCGLCAKVCPQKIRIPEVLHTLHQTLGTMPSWAKMSRERAKANEKAKK